MELHRGGGDQVAGMAQVSSEVLQFYEGGLGGRLRLGPRVGP